MTWLVQSGPPCGAEGVLFFRGKGMAIGECEVNV